MSDWRGDDYDRISAPHAAMGAPALDRLELRGDERVLDAGCGSGPPHRAAPRAPARSGRVVALDGSASMLTEAARRLARFGGRVTLSCRPTWAGHRCPSTDRSTPSCPRPPSTGSSTTTPSSRAWPASCGAAASSPSSAAARATPTALIAGRAGRGRGDRGQLPHGRRGRDAGAPGGRTGSSTSRAWLEPQTIAFETREEIIDYIVTPYLRPATGLPEAELQRSPDAMADRLGGPRHRLRPRSTSPAAQGLVSRVELLHRTPRSGWRC